MATPPSLQPNSRASTGFSQQPTLKPGNVPTPSPSPLSNNAFDRAQNTLRPSSTVPSSHNGGSPNPSPAPAAPTPSTPSPSTKSKSSLRTAINQFLSRLSGQHFTNFPKTSYEDLCREIMLIQQQQEGRKRLMNLFRINACLERLNQFGKVIEVFLNVSDVVALIWGPMKFVLQTACEYVEVFESIIEAYESLGENMPLLQRYERLFPQDPQMTGALELIYVDILKFHQKAVGFLSGKVWHRVFKSLWKGYSTEFKGILSSLGRHKKFVESCVQLSYMETSTDALARLEATSAAQFRQYQDELAIMKQQLASNIDKEEQTQLNNVQEWLAVESRSDHDHVTYQEVRFEHSSTTDWILNHEKIKDWVALDNPTTPLLWMHGIPGAGKTILASTIIDCCSKKADFSTRFFYCHDGDQGSNTAMSILKGLIGQFLNSKGSMVPLCYARRTTSNEPILRANVTLARKLLEELCLITPKAFIIVDGLDECINAERKQITDILMDLVGHCNASDPGKLRVLLVSQYSPDIYKSLHSSTRTSLRPGILTIEETDYRSEIHTYVASWVDQIAQKFQPMSDELRDYLTNVTVNNSKGMFLYAKLVMSNLYHQPTRLKLEEAIREDNFPRALGDAYERIIRRIQDPEVTSPQEWEIARKLLGWMVCAKRQLTWKEMQAALSINIEQQTVDYEYMSLRRHIQDICGSLISVNGDTVSLVHSTARTYITTVTKEIYAPSIECEMAVLCLEYLTFPCFELETDPHMEDILEGCFAFQDYAIAKWFYHVNAFVKSGPEFLREVSNPEAYLDALSATLDNFTARFDEPWDSTIVEDCRRSCEAFDKYNLYDNLLVLTSHIYTHQQKGFDARHKISIKDLDSALVRNRKCLEDVTSGLGPSDLVRYQRFHDDQRRFKCDRITCRFFFEGFKDAKDRDKHVKFHTRPYHCDVPDCLGEHGFVNQADLDRHVKVFHPEMVDLSEIFKSAQPKPERKVGNACTICGKTFSRNFHRKNHEASHRGERPHECPECGKAFTRLNDCKRHQKLHERK